MESSSLRIGWQDSLVTHGPIALRCPGSGRLPPMNAPLISGSFPNIVRNSRSRPIECEFWKMLQGHVLHQNKVWDTLSSTKPLELQRMFFEFLRWGQIRMRALVLFCTQIE